MAQLTDLPAPEVRAAAPITRPLRGRFILGQGSQQRRDRDRRVHIPLPADRLRDRLDRPAGGTGNPGEVDRIDNAPPPAGAAGWQATSTPAWVMRTVSAATSTRTGSPISRQGTE